MERKQTREASRPFSIRLTGAEKAALMERAAGLPLGIFIRQLTLEDKADARVRRRQSPIIDSDALGRVLALLGQSRLASNLNQLAQQANSGSLYFDEDTRANLNHACADVRTIRALLMQALGKTPSDSPPEPLSETFAAAAAPEAGP